MDMKYVLVGGFVVVIIGLMGVAFYQNRQPGELDSFAQCIVDSGAKFYGAFWCPHCQSQKKMFGKSAELLPYIECSTPDGRGQLAECTALGIEGYPTWIFADESRLNGEVSLEQLAEKTSCERTQ